MPSRAPTSSSSTRIGELATIYQLATVVFVGGSLVATGGHNILEPAVFGKPIVFGPHMENFAEIADAFVANGAGVQVRGERELDEMLRRADDRSGAARAARRGGARPGRSQSRREGQVARGARGAAAAGSDDDVSVQRPAVQTHCLTFSTRRPSRARRRWYERHPQARRRLQRPVISIGNLSVGGTGKTPLVARDRGVADRARRAAGDPEPRLRARRSRRTAWSSCPTAPRCSAISIAPATSR